MRPNPWILLVLLASLAGFTFAAVSTHDFVVHLDRQVHGIHCSFLPGLTAADATQTSGCHVTLMSPYSSVFRESIWGGLPIALPAMGVFSFLFFFAASLWLGARQRDRRATGFLWLGTLVPVGASLVMGYLSLQVLDAACKLCIGIYAASTACFLGALMAFLGARRQPEPHPAGPLPAGWLAGAFALGVLFVAVPSYAYSAQAPDFEHYVGSCGELSRPQDPRDVLVPLGSARQGMEMIEVIDPLCNACKGFEERLSHLDVAGQLSRKALLFPLDPSCNWMVDTAIHPGACAISEAMLCAADGAQTVLGWAFDNQEAIMEAATSDPKAAERMAEERFPELSNCIGSPAAKAKLNLALRWAVDNELQVLTPQVFVQGLQLCNEDTDLGLDYALPRLVEMARARPAPDPRAPAKALPSTARADAARRAQPRPRAEPAQAPPPEAAPKPPPGPAATAQDEPDATGEVSTGDEAKQEVLEPVQDEPDPAAAQPTPQAQQELPVDLPTPQQQEQP